MSGWFNFWHGLTPGQGTLLGGAFVVVAGIISFGTGAWTADHSTSASTTRR